MRNAFLKRLMLLILVWAFSFSACTQKEDVVMPQENCDTLAVVQYVPSCGLQLLLENNRVVVPLNASYAYGPNNELVFKINGFPVLIGQQIIIGYKQSQVELGPTPCNVAGYGHNNLVDINCIAGIEQDI